MATEAVILPARVPGFQRSKTSSRQQPCTLPLAVAAGLAMARLLRTSLFAGARCFETTSRASPNRPFTALPDTAEPGGVSGLIYDGVTYGVLIVFLETVLTDTTCYSTCVARRSVDSRIVRLFTCIATLAPWLGLTDGL